MAPAKVRREAPEACFSAHLYPVLSNDLPPQFSPRARPKDSRLFFHQMGGGHFNRTTTGDFDGPRMAKSSARKAHFRNGYTRPTTGVQSLLGPFFEVTDLQGLPEWFFLVPHLDAVGGGRLCLEMACIWYKSISFSTNSICYQSIPFSTKYI
jgi:hypothetical protein